MNWALSTLYLPPNVVDLQVADLNRDGVQEIVVAAKSSLEQVPAPISLFVYHNVSGEWQKKHRVDLGTTPTFWTAYQGLWGLNANGVINLLNNQMVVEYPTWLTSLKDTSPKYGSFVTDLGYDGRLDFVIQGPNGVDIFDENGVLQRRSTQPMEGSIREYNKTGGVQVEVAQRSRPLLLRDVDGDGQQEVIWLNQDAAVVDSNQSVQIKLPINVEPQYTSRPKRSINYIDWMDVNGDQRVDLIWQYWINGNSWFGGSSEIGLALGQPEGFLDPTIIPESRAVMNVQMVDLDGDGDIEVWSTGVDLGVAALSRTVLSQTAHTTIQVFEMTPTGPDLNPIASLGVSIPIGQENAFDYRVIPDQNQDGVSDLLMQIGTELSIWHSADSSWRVTEKTSLNHRGNLAINCNQGCQSDTIVLWNTSSNQATIVEGL